MFLAPYLLSLFNKGSNFAIKEILRKLRMNEFFSEVNENESENENEIDNNEGHLIKLKSTFTPPRNRNKTLDIVIDFLHKQNFENETKKTRSNITKREYDGLVELKKNKDIIIKEADKGGAVVIINITKK